MHTERVGRSGWALWLLLVVFAFWGGEARGGRAGWGREGAVARGHGRAHAAAGGAQAMPPALRAAYLAARQAEGGAGYAVREGEGGLVADNPAQGFSVAFSEEGVALAGAGAPRATLRPVRFGCAGETREVGRARPEVREGRVAFPREGFVEWYVNGPLGLEQGFSVDEAPRCAGASVEALEVELRLGEGLSASLEAGGEQIALRDEAGQRVLGVSELYALDAKGNALPARLGVTSAHGVSMRVETAGAEYPVVIDPLVWKEQQQLFPNGGADKDKFGQAVALSGDTALVGSYGNAEKGQDAGAAYVFVRQGASWSQQAKLLPNDGAAGDFFGSSVALSGDTALVGAPSNDAKAQDAGAAYVFLRQGASWSQQQKLLPSDGAAGDTFGNSVALSGDTALIGVPGNDAKAQDAGAAYVFLRQGASWSQQQKLLPSDGAVGDVFGNSVALSGDTALVGASGNDAKGQNAGAAYVFLRQGVSWNQQQKLLPGDGTAGDAFGASVALSGDTALVGAPGRAAYVFLRQGASWSQQAKLLSSVGVGDQFGASVALSGDTALVGAQIDSSKGLFSGAVYVFLRQGASWSQQAILLATDGTQYEYFGASVALSGDTALIGQGNLVAGSAYAFVRAGASWSQQERIHPSDLSAGDQFGTAVAISGDTALVGAPAKNTKGSYASAAYIFFRQGASWNPQAKLLASDGAANDQFGISVALSGETALVGASGNSAKGSGAGAVYVFLRQGASWSQQQKLLPNDGAAGNEFGLSVALDGETALVGAWLNTDKAQNAGAAYVFLRQGASWSQQAKLLASDGAKSDYLGRSVALFGDTALVGAYGNGEKGVAAGAAYVFFRQGASWSQQAKLLPSDAASGYVFGYAVALSGDTALVGAQHGQANGQGAGAAYVFLRQGASWSQQAKLFPSDGMSGDEFGASVAISGDTAIVGAHQNSEQGLEAGAAYVFLRQGASWSQQAKLLASDGDIMDYFGQAVSVSGENALVGALNHLGTGAAYTFVLTESGCSKDTDCPAPPPGACAFAVCNTATKTCGTREKLDGAPCPAGVCIAGGCLADSISEASSTTSASSAASAGSTTSAGSAGSAATSAGSAGSTGSTSAGTGAGGAGAGGADSGPPELHLKGGGCECATRGAPSHDAFGHFATLLLGLLPLARRRSRRRP